MNISQAVILAGGKGTRLMPLTADRPKPMVEIHGRPFLEYLIDLLKENGIKRVLILTGHMAEKITDHFGDGSKFGVEISYHYSEPDAETGTRLRNAKKLLDNEFLLLYSDNYWPLKLEKLLAFHRAQTQDGTMVVYSNRDKYSKNNVRVGENSVIELYDKSRTAEGLNGIDVGFFLLKKSALKLLPEGNLSFEAEVLPQLVDKRKLGGFLTDHRYYTIGSLERFEQAVAFLKPKKVALLDRDGTLNHRAPKAQYITKQREYRFLPGTIDALVELSKKGYELYIVSNQPGIARGLLSESDLADIHVHMQHELLKYGVVIGGIYYCPHGWDDGCECRKPKPGMLFQAAREQKFDLTKAIFVGDDERDGEAAEAADTPFIMVPSDIGIAAAVDKLP